MAMATTTVGSGFKINADKARAQKPEVDDEAPLTAEEELLLKVAQRLRQGFPAAALAAAVDLVNSIAAKHGLGGGAYL